MKPEEGGAEVINTEQRVGSKIISEPGVSKSKHEVIRAVSVDRMDVVVTEQRVSNAAEVEEGVSSNMDTGQRVGS